jgi:hypothetical protein
MNDEKNGFETNQEGKADGNWSLSPIVSFNFFSVDCSNEFRTLRSRKI